MASARNGHAEADRGGKRQAVREGPGVEVTMEDADVMRVAVVAEALMQAIGGPGRRGRFAIQFRLFQLTVELARLRFDHQMVAPLLNLPELTALEAVTYWLDGRGEHVSPVANVYAIRAEPEPAKAALFEDAQQHFPSEWRDLGYAILIVGLRSWWPWYTASFSRELRR